ncbi:hypothetical protein BCR43DRAFT_521653 [Syncephalastrum racemosum]|uniref:Uncharacterized protein n=1 Tax=Syncephalastrum racemosum TaxID=13706 RepID=A0A1X2HMZ0_SYNRA|nr:hypothetical protein BCR43DRAFT_521653 [Syncephalastrum racemosum]
MVHPRCQQLHTAVRSNCRRQPLFNFLTECSTTHPRTPFCIRHVHSSRRAQADASMFNFLREINDQTTEFNPSKKNKKALQRRVPRNVSDKINQHVRSPLAMQIHSCLEHGERLKAWELFDTTVTNVSVHRVPHVVAVKLLDLLVKDVKAMSVRHRMADEKYLQRLELLLQHVRKSTELYKRRSFNSVLYAFGKLGAMERAETVFRHMKTYCSDPPDTHTFNILAGVYVYNLNHVDRSTQDRYLAKTWHLLKTMAAAGLAPDTSTFNTLLSACAKTRSIPETLETCQAMVEAGVPVNQRTLNIVLNIYGKTRSQDIDAKVTTLLHSILDRLTDAEKKPDSITYATAIRNAIHDNDMVSAMEMVKNMVRIKMRLNDYILSHLVQGFVHAGDLQRAHTLLQDMEKEPYGLAPNRVAYTSLIQGYAKSLEINKAYKVFSEMVDKGVSADLITYTCLANMVVKASAGTELRETIDLLENYGKLNPKWMDGTGHLDRAALTVLVEAHGKAGAWNAKMAEAALGHEDQERSLSKRDYHATAAYLAYNQIHEQGVCDQQATTALLTAYARMHKPNMAWTLWQRLKEDSIPLGVINYNALIMAFVNDPVWYPMAKNVFEDMVGAPVFAGSRREPGPLNGKPDLATFDLLLHGAHNADDHDGVRRLWLSPYRPGPQPAEHTTSHIPHSLLVRSYYYAMRAFLEGNDRVAARDVHDEYLALPRPQLSAHSYILRIAKLDMDAPSTSL